MLGGLRARPNEIKARSSRPTWKNCSLWLCNVQCWSATQYCSTETVLLIFPFLQIRWGQVEVGGGVCTVKVISNFLNIMRLNLCQWYQSISVCHATLISDRLLMVRNYDQFWVLCQGERVWKLLPDTVKPAPVSQKLPVVEGKWLTVVCCVSNV